MSDDVYYGYDGKPQTPPKWWQQARHARLRSERLAVARQKGVHTKSEWVAIRDAFDCCVACGISYADLYGYKPTSDHIVPITAGGCDCIANIQPLCRECNSGKTHSADLRNSARPGWVAQYIENLERDAESP